MSMTMHVRLTVWQLIEARPARRAAAVRRRCLGAAAAVLHLPLPPPLPPFLTVLHTLIVLLFHFQNRRSAGQCHVHDCKGWGGGHDVSLLFRVLYAM